MKAQVYISIFFFLVAFVGAASAAILTVTPNQVVVGEFVTIEGSGFGINETVTLSCSVSDFEVPISDTNYKYSLENFNLSDSNTSFSLSAREVKDDVEVHIEKLGSSVVINKSSPTKYGFAFDYNVTTNTSTVAVPMPIDPLYTGVYELIEVSGTASGSATEVYMDVTVINNVTTDATGYFKTVIDTHGIPTGEYTITADGVNATLNVTTNPITFTATCPVDLSATDPDGLTINKSSNEIPGATYTETDINGDGDLDDQIIIPARKIGDYQITVIPEPGAESTDTYTLEVSAGDTAIVLAEDVPISDIPDQPYTIESTEEGLIATYEIALTTGWNLISVPLNLTTWVLGNESEVGTPLNITPKNNLTSVYRYNTTTGLFDKCDHLDDWGWAPATGSESFAALEPGRGYWVRAENACNLTFTGTQPSDLDVTLKENWNLIGWYSQKKALLGNESVVGDPLNVTPENSLTSVYRYNYTTGSFDKCDHLDDDWGWAPATGSERFTALEPGRGYWVSAEDECVWRHKI